MHTILIVDDTPANVDLLDAILSPEYLIRAASSGSEALESVRLMQPDLILLDIMMPGLNGYEVCSILKADQVTCRIPVIFVTTLLEPGDETCGFEAGGSDYITRPVVGAVVRSRVKAQLALRDAQLALEEWNTGLKRRLFESIKTIRIAAEEDKTLVENQAGTHQSVKLLLGVFELMDDAFAVRSLAVSKLAGEAARKMNFAPEDVAKVKLAGLLHDVGTLGFSRRLSDKPQSAMTANELDVFHAHTLRGAALFADIEGLQDVGLMVRGHHEDYSGMGFPDGLKGDDIPVGARLLAIAAFIEHSAGIVSNECAEYALMKARMNAGTQLDSSLICHFTMITRVLYFEAKSSNRSGEVPHQDLHTVIV
jgi:putative two-component system response regulator